MAGATDAAALAALRRTWTEENAGNVADERFEARFIEWYERESARRLTWLAEIESQPVGMMNLSVFERMPRPGTEVGRWGYVGNAFVLAEHRDQGIGSLLLASLLAYADSNGFVRVVLRPTQRATPFYQRAGFGTDGGLLVRPGRLAGRLMLRWVSMVGLLGHALSGQALGDVRWRRGVGGIVVPDVPGDHTVASREAIAGI